MKTPIIRCWPHPSNSTYSKLKSSSFIPISLFIPPPPCPASTSTCTHSTSAQLPCQMCLCFPNQPIPEMRLIHNLVYLIYNFSILRSFSRQLNLGECSFKIALVYIPSISPPWEDSCLYPLFSITLHDLRQSPQFLIFFFPY